MFQLFSYSKIMHLSALLVIMSACGHSNPEIKGGNSQPVRVKVATSADVSSPNSDCKSYSGTVEAGSSTAPGFAVAGKITRINVTEGQRISKGQLIASVDGTSLKSAYDIATATLREAQDAYNRMKKLHDAKALPDMQWISVQENLKQAQAAAEIARKEMDDANLYAPISGIVAHKLADVGQMAVPSVPVVEIMDVNTLKAKISVTESDLVKMKSGSKAMVTAGEKSFPATLTEKGIAANSLSRTYDVKFSIDKPDASLLPGMICNVTLNNDTNAASEATLDIVLPPQAVVLDWDNTPYVWVKKDGLAQRVKVGMAGLDSRGIIVTGITHTDSVIVEGQQKLSQGLKVISIN